MYRTFLFLLSCILSISCTDKATDTGDPGPDGAALYTSKCAACHGEDGLGNHHSLPDLVPARTDAELEEVIRNGTGSMPGGLVSDDSEVAAVVDYLRATWGE